MIETKRKRNEKIVVAYSRREVRALKAMLEVHIGVFESFADDGRPGANEQAEELRALLAKFDTYSSGLVH